MRAVQVRRYVKSPQDLIVKRLPDPTPQPNEYVIEISAAAANLSDLLQIQGRSQNQPPFPFIAGSEFAGTVIATPKQRETIRVTTSQPLRRQRTSSKRDDDDSISRSSRSSRSTRSSSSSRSSRNSRSSKSSKSSYDDAESKHEDSLAAAANHNHNHNHDHNHSTSTSNNDDAESRDSRSTAADGSPDARGSGVGMEEREAEEDEELMLQEDEDELDEDLDELEMEPMEREMDYEPFPVGSRVFGCAQGAFATKICVPAIGLRLIPDGWSFRAAAGLFSAAPTAYAALVARARVREGDTVLVHAAAGSVGLAAIQIAKAHGARVIAMVSPSPHHHGPSRRLPLSQHNLHSGSSSSSSSSSNNNGSGALMTTTSSSSAAHPHTSSAAAAMNSYTGINTTARGAVATAVNRKSRAARLFGADHVLSYDEPDWPAKVRALTPRDRGVDIVLDPVGLVERSIQCTAWNGRVLVVGFAGGAAERIPAPRVLLKNIALVGVYWGGHYMHEPHVVDEVWDGVMRLVADGKIRSMEYRDEEFVGLVQVKDALSRLARRETWGKVVIRIPKERVRSKL